jgi:hypothetical protein
MPSLKVLASTAGTPFSVPRIAADALTILGVVAFAITPIVSVWARSQSTAERRADELVQQLRQFRPGLPPSGPRRDDGDPIPAEMLRIAVYDELRTLGATAVPALTRGLADPDVHLRQNVAPLLYDVGGCCWEPEKPRLDLRPYLKALIAALADGDSRVRGLAAGAIGNIGAPAASAVPALVALLTNPDEGSRGSACIALDRIGPPARAALPALQKALTDSSPNVRFFALRAIGSISALN